MMMLYKPASTTGGLLLSVAAGASVKGSIATDVDTYLWQRTGGDAFSTPWSTNTAKWHLVGVTKTTASFPRFHYYNLTDGGSTSHVPMDDVSNGSGDTSGNWTLTEINSFSGTVGTGMKAACAMVVDTVYSDGDFDGVASAKSTASMLALATTTGDRVWNFNQAAVTDEIFDLKSNTDDQTTRVGTTVVGGDDPPGWIFEPTFKNAPTGMFSPELDSKAWF
jgi:hypothetical protein